GAPALAGPDLGDAHPHGAVLIALTPAVPEELHLDAAVLVRVDLLSLWTDHHRRLDALDKGFGRAAHRPVVDRGGNAGEGVAISGGFAVVVETGFLGIVLDAGQHIGLLLGLALVPGEPELGGGREGAASAGASHDVVARLLFLHARFGERLAVG